ncbi:MAG: recombinase family protein [Planctomycetia bacterium]|nr:recombinase family protein [Planctomycetia bacterium]
MNAARTEKKTFRCAVYTRVSTSEQAEQEFSSIDAQREAGESYIASQRHEGWELIPAHYDDPGFTGANVDRPGLRRLMADIEAGKVDVIVVYKVDRLSRSLMDFSRLIETFDKHKVSFVSVTQAFSTTTSMGRLTLNILLSFAQFEREMISERTRDKIAAARRKGKWAGGRPILGYDVVNSKLVVNTTEATRVRKIFKLYLEFQALIPTVTELARRGWTTKMWTTKKGGQYGGVPFDKGNLYNLLTNVAYTGKVRHLDQVFAGEHEPIVDPAVFEQVQALLRKNHRTGGADVRNKFGALLKGLLRCSACNCGMPHSHSTRDGTKRYRYYVCMQAQKRGWDTCPTKSVSAPEIEKFVVDQIRAIGRDPALVAETLAQARGQVEARLGELEAERRRLEQDLGQHHREVRELAISGMAGEPTMARLGDLNERIRQAELRLGEIHTEVGTLRGDVIDEADLTRALAAFDPVWEQLNLREQASVVQLLVERVEYDGRTGDVAITFHPAGIKTLNAEIAEEQESAA